MASSSARFETPGIDLQAPDKDCDAIRTIPELIDFNAKHNPDLLFCEQATKASQNAIAITHLQLWHAILRCSTRLIAEIAELKCPSENDEGGFAKSQPVALFLESDVGLLIHLFALMSLGVPVSPPFVAPDHIRKHFAYPTIASSTNLASKLRIHVIGGLILSNR